MDLRRQEETERDAFIDECLSDMTIRDQIAIVSRKYRNEMQVLIKAWHGIGNLRNPGILSVTL
jgi:hypothetical protein